MTRRELPATYREPPKRRGGLIAFGVLMAGLILAGFLILLQNTINQSATEPAEEFTTTPTVQVIEIPPVGGRLEADAQSSLASLGLRVAVTRVSDNDVRAGQVILTDPAAGSQVPEGTTVTMFVSSGASLRAVPSVTTLTENEALQAISRAGFEPSRQAVTDDQAPEGEVVRQTPIAGTLVEPGTVVTYEVSIGTEQLPVPEVQGMSAAEARLLLEAEGFIVPDTFETANDEEIPREQVLGTIPEVGEAVPPGSEIRIVISDGPEALLVPSLLGLDKGAAFIELQSLGLVPVEFGQFVFDPAQVNKVIDTIPGPNAEVQPGDQIQVLTGLLSPNAGFDDGSQGGDFSQN